MSAAFSTAPEAGPRRAAREPGAERGFVPVIVRVAGLPADVVEGLASPLCVRVAELDALEAELASARAALADRLHAAVPDAGPALRRLLLAARRDCFNGRPLERHRGAPGWPALCEAAGGAADRVAALEASAAAAKAAFEAEHAAERDRQRARVAATLHDPAFARELALASPDLYRAARRLGGGGDGLQGRARRKAEANLLRYASRAATKLSPFATFTRLGLGTLAGGAFAGVRLAGGGWRARSLVRVKPYLLEKCGEMLRRHRPIRDGLRVVVNSSVTEVAPGRFLYLRPSHWDLDEAAGRLVYRAEALVGATLRGPLVGRLAALLGGPQALTRGELVEALGRELADGAAAAERQVDELVRIGFLVLAFPWSGHDGRLERRMLASLRRLPAAAGAGAFAGRLERLVALQAGFARAADPAAAVEAQDRLIDDLWTAAAPLGGVEPGAGLDRAASHSLYEDVWVRPAGGAGARGEVARVSRAAAREALASAEPLARFACLFDHRHDALHALDAFARRQWPGRGEVPLLELFHQAQPLWQEYLRFFQSAREAAGGWRSTWNPLELAAVEALAGHRAALVAGMKACLRRDSGQQVVDGAALAALLDGVPGPYAAADGGACLFLQPAGPGGRLWVLNRIKEGTARFGSRFTPVMDAETRRRYTRHLVRRGVVEQSGEPAELLDLRCMQGDTLNVHARQTPRVLALPGDEGGDPPARRVSLGELVVRLGAPGGLPHLRDRAGRRYVTAHLGFAVDDYLPSLVRFLSLFGPSEMSAAFPPRWMEDEGEVRAGRRTVLGTLVLHRRTWDFPARLVLERTAGLGEAQAFAALNRWRAAAGIPDRVFLAERVPHPQKGERWQPQYLDFTSPLFAQLFLAAAAGGGERVSLSEALPDPAHFPRGEGGLRWAAEVLVDSLALRPAAPRRGARGPAAPA